MPCAGPAIRSGVAGWAGLVWRCGVAYGTVHSMDAALRAVQLPMADPDWTTPELLTRFGLPLVLVALGVGLFLWGRREQREARSRIGSKGGFGGPPGTLDIGSELGFGVEGRGPDPHAGRAKILAGAVAAVVGAVLLVSMGIWNLVT